MKPRAYLAVLMLGTLMLIIWATLVHILLAGVGGH